MAGSQRCDSPASKFDYHLQPEHSPDHPCTGDPLFVVPLSSFVKWLLRGSPPPAVRTQRTASEVIELARQAAQGHGLRDSLNVATPQREAKGVITWRVETGGVGASLQILIDDASGEIVGRRERGGR